MEVVSLTFATKNTSAIEMHLGAVSKSFHNSFSTRRLTAHQQQGWLCLFSLTVKSKGAVTEVLSDQKSSAVPVITIKIWAKAKGKSFIKAPNQQTLTCRGKKPAPSTSLLLHSERISSKPPEIVLNYADELLTYSDTYSLELLTLWAPGCNCCFWLLLYLTFKNRVPHLVWYHSSQHSLTCLNLQLFHSDIINTLDLKPEKKHEVRVKSCNFLLL